MPSRVGTVTKFVLLDFLGSVIRFPFWWYSDGLMSVVRWMGRSLQYRWRGYAIGLWVSHFFTPMYNSYDFTGRLISIVMRFVVIVARCFAFGVEAMLSALLVAIWFFAPPICLICLLLTVSSHNSWSSAFFSL